MTTEPWTDDDSEAYAEQWARLGRQPNHQPTPDQVMRFIREAPDRLALELARRMEHNQETAARCFEEQHPRQLEALRAELDELRPPRWPSATETTRHAALAAASEDLHGMQGTLQTVRARLHDLTDVTRASQAVARIEPAIEAAQNAVLEAWDGEP